MDKEIKEKLSQVNNLSMVALEEKEGKKFVKKSEEKLKNLKNGENCRKKKV